MLDDVVDSFLNVVRENYRKWLNITKISKSKKKIHFTINGRFKSKKMDYLKNDIKNITGEIYIIFRKRSDFFYSTISQLPN